jgi:hypothetical protein
MTRGRNDRGRNEGQNVWGDEMTGTKWSGTKWKGTKCNATQWDNICQSGNPWFVIYSVVLRIRQRISRFKEGVKDSSRTANVRGNGKRRWRRKNEWGGQAKDFKSFGRLFKQPPPQGSSPPPPSFTDAHTLRQSGKKKSAKAPFVIAD